MKEIRPLIPVNPEGLDKIANELLNENISSSDPIQIGTNPPTNPKDYLILETVDGKNNGIGLYVAKAKDFFSKNWYETHEALNKEGYQMLTIRQGIDLIKLLKTGKVYDGLKAKLKDAEIAQLFNEIVEVRTPWRAEWLDGRFVKEDNEFYLLQEHKYDTSKSRSKLEERIIAKNRIKVDPLMKNTRFNLNDVNQYGLPTKEGTELDYWYPTNGSVAWFRANSVGAGLICDRDSADSDAGLGVRRAKTMS